MKIYHYNDTHNIQQLVFSFEKRFNKINDFNEVLFYFPILVI